MAGLTAAPLAMALIEFKPTSSGFSRMNFAAFCCWGVSSEKESTISRTVSLYCRVTSKDETNDSSRDDTDSFVAREGPMGYFYKRTL